MQKPGCLLALSILFTVCPSFAETQVINVHALSAAPVLDSFGQDWEGIQAQQIPLQPNKTFSQVDVQSVHIKAGYHGEKVYFYFQWSDSEASLVHKPYVWNTDSQRYLRGPQREDRLALQFEMEGDYSADWRDSRHFKADMWHWKASRSNPLGLVHDKYTVHSPNKLLRSSVVQGAAGHSQYVKRESDAGTKIYTTKRYRKQADPIMPKYILNAEVAGSVADIEAKGRWREGRWHLEMSRKLNTGHSDDVVFVPGTSVKGAIAIFEASESDDHGISQTLIFQF
ncbi:MAG: ethylbenzene dehydrogenase-related protein [Amphritea sp.]